jgi:small subunit ribosomal protein S14|mmetsp:Transcript_14870/g.61877  ORF Transcript_14870/g.61877 Transcript_14870/m.61877 type:complete len:101 (-) Transcript_14870:421-723(-)
MARKGTVYRDKKRRVLVQKYATKRAKLLNEFKSASTIGEKLKIHAKIQKLPRNSSRTRLHNRCFITGRPKGYFRFFGLSRHQIRELGYVGVLPGVTTASW